MARGLVTACLLLLFVGTWSAGSTYAATEPVEDGAAARDGVSAAARQEESELCRMYLRAVKASSLAERLAVARQVGASRLPIEEKAWLTLMLLAPEMTLDEARALVTAGTQQQYSGEIGEYKSRSIRFPSGITLEGWDTGEFVSATFSLARIHSRRRPEPAASIDATATAAHAPLESTDRSAGPGGRGDELCNLWLAVAAAADDGRYAVAEKIANADLTDAQRAWLCFHLVDVGMSAVTADRLLTAALRASPVVNKREATYDDVITLILSLDLSKVLEIRLNVRVP